MARFEDACAALQSAGELTAYRYPDAANEMEREVISSKGRAEERALWDQLTASLPTENGCAWDAGCGLGAFTAPLCSRFSHVLSTDADPSRIAHAGKDAPSHAVFRAVPLLDDRLSKPSFQRTFSFVQCIQVLGHIPIDDVSRALSVLSNARTEGGSLILAVPFTNGPADAFWVTGRTSQLIHGAPSTAVQFDALTRTPQPGLLPVRHFSMPTLNRLLRDVGITPREVRPYNWLHATRADVMLSF